MEVYKQYGIKCHTIMQIKKRYIWTQIGFTVPVSPPVWQYDSVQQHGCSPREHSSPNQAPAQKRRSCLWWLWLGNRRSWTLRLAGQLQPSLGRHPDGFLRGQTWWAFKNHPAGAERCGEVFSGPRPCRGHGQSCVCGFRRYKAWFRAVQASL